MIFENKKVIKVIVILLGIVIIVIVFMIIIIKQVQKSCVMKEIEEKDGVFDGGNFVFYKLSLGSSLGGSFFIFLFGGWIFIKDEIIKM